MTLFTDCIILYELQRDTISVGTYTLRMLMSSVNSIQSKVPWMVSRGWPEYNTRA